MEHLLPSQYASHFAGLADGEESNTLVALLEDPAYAIAECLKDCDDEHAEGRNTRAFLKVDLTWSEVATTVPGIAGDVLHEASQAFTRCLLGGRTRSFRIHRFTLSDPSALNEQLVPFATSTMMAGPGVDVSNIGGFHSKQDLFDYEEARALRDVCSCCARAAARAICEEAGAPPPKEGSEPYAWVNVSTAGNLNQLHNHDGATLASTYYAQVPPTGPLQGTLLFRLTPASGLSQSDPDEERHVPWMGPAEQGALDGQSIEGGLNPDHQAVAYAELHPSPGSFVVFPAWLSHSVAPTSEGAMQRISFAANWDFQVPTDDFPPDWQWFRD